jgi:hypothetical protein
LSVDEKEPQQPVSKSNNNQCLAKSEFSFWWFMKWGIVCVIPSSVQERQWAEAFSCERRSLVFTSEDGSLHTLLHL